ncbi:MAG: hypothetical protein FDZ69_09455 [Deltaproteobacteria bacterium]|nr:MAG: hypothetical protein FDZ69_09455 [Deltaproteobacteria bacterium]
MKDRFTEASLELAGNSAFGCKECETLYGHPTFMHLETMGGRQFDVSTKGPDCILNCDPLPFGD